MNEKELDDLAGKQTMKFITWMESAHGFVPYGFYGDIKRAFIEIGKKALDKMPKEDK